MTRLPAVLSILLSLGVAHAGGRMRPSANPQPPAADPNKATVVFVTPSDRNAGASALLDESGRAIGEVAGKTRIVVQIAPGGHKFVRAIYKNADKGDYRLWGHEVCNQIAGEFAAGKIYFVEVSVFRLYKVKPDQPKLVEWANAQPIELDPGQANASVAADPEWQKCLNKAWDNAGSEKKKNDDRSVIAPGDGFAAWPR
jgi:hypothetical protein